MENIKYYLLSLLSLMILLNWYAAPSIKEDYNVKSYLSTDQVYTLIKYPKQKKFVYKNNKYIITSYKSNIPFIYSKIDTSKCISTKYYYTDYKN